MIVGLTTALRGAATVGKELRGRDSHVPSKAGLGTARWQTCSFVYNFSVLLGKYGLQNRPIFLIYFHKVISQLNDL